MYLAHARTASGEILDAACGTGRVLVPLVEAGHRVTGVDSSQAMLRLARSKLTAVRLSRKARLIEADLRTFELGREFGLALVALGSFHHLLTTGDQRAALASLAAHLRPGGLLVLDLVNPAPDWLSAADGVLVHQMTASFPDAGGPERLTKLVARQSRLETQSDHQLLMYDRIGPDGTLTRRVFEMEFRYVSRYEAELLLDEAGFRVIGLYGSYGMEHYAAGSLRMIFVAEKR
jgi:SAM-dependent methyltransferase